MKETVTVFVSIYGELVVLDTALVSGLTPEIAKEFLGWVNRLQEDMLKPRTCPFCHI